MRQSSSRASPDHAYTLIEVLMVIIVLASVLSIGGALFFRTYQRLGASTVVVDAHVDIGIAADLMERDIKEAVTISEEGGHLRLTNIDGAGIEWSVRDNTLMRTTPEGARSWRSTVTAMTVNVESPRPGAVYVEAVIESDRDRERGTPRQTFYVSARQRVEGTR